MALIKKEGDDYVFVAGKHQGKTLQEVAEDSPGYIRWLHDGDAGSDLSKEAWEAIEDVMEENGIDPE